MILLTYMGILLFCYGIYNLCCYFCMLPTACAGRNLLKLQRKKIRLCNNAFIVGISERIVKEWELEWNSSETMNAILKYNGIYYITATYFISLLLFIVCGLLLCLPLLFMGLRWFCISAAGVLLYVSADYLLLLFRYQRHITGLKAELPLLGLLAEKYFQEKSDLDAYIELCLRVSDNDWKSIWRELLQQKNCLSEEIKYQCRGWRNEWLLRFAEGLLAEEKHGFFNDFCEELDRVSSEQREKRLQRICRLTGLLPGTLILGLILLLVLMLT